MRLLTQLAICLPDNDQSEHVLMPSAQRIQPSRDCHGLLELVALANNAIELMDTPPDVSYWLSGYKIHEVTTPKTQKVLSRQQKFQADNTVLSLTSEGGVHPYRPSTSAEIWRPASVA